MNDELGFAFALPRLIARLAGRKARRAELSGGEAYGVGFLVFGMGCLAVARVWLAFVRPGGFRWLGLLLLPVVVWFGFLLLYYLLSRLAGGMRRLRLYTAPTNKPVLHFASTTFVTLFAIHLLRFGGGVSKSLGAVSLTLVGLNLLALLVLRWRHEE